MPATQALSGKFVRGLLIMDQGTSVEKQMTYKEPTRKTERSAIFFRSLSCRPAKTTNGRTRTAKSATVFNMLVEISEPLASTVHLPTAGVWAKTSNLSQK